MSWIVYRCDSCGRSVTILHGAALEVRCGACRRGMGEIGELPSDYYSKDRVSV